MHATSFGRDEGDSRLRTALIAVMLFASGCLNAFLADGIIGKQVRATA